MSSPDPILKPIRSRHKLGEVKQSLRQLAQQNPVGTRLPTVKELCRQLNVAVATLDAALESLEATGVITRQRGSGIFVGPGVVHKTIGVIFSVDIFEAGTSPVFREILRQCQHRAETHHERFSFYIDIEEEGGRGGAGQIWPAHQDLMRDLAGERLNGLLLLWPESQRQDAEMRGHGIPVVSLECNALQKKGGVRLDYAELQRQATQALLDQGCRRIGFIQALSDLPPALDLLEKGGATCRPEWVWRPGKPLAQLNSTNEEIGFQAVRQMLRASAEGPDGLVIMDDMFTRGALAALRKLGKRLGKDLKIATHANKGSSALFGYEDELILVAFDPAEIVETLFQMLETSWETSQPVSTRVLKPLAPQFPK
jgi:DNA-binding LacI/PurR family transcriptional regulator